MRWRVRLVFLGLLAAVGAGLLVLGDRVLGRLVDPRFVPLVGPRDADEPLVRREFRVRVRTNAEGFRGPPLPGRKPAGGVRVVVLGDSFTFGYGVRERQGYPARLARRLERLGVGGGLVEVVNLGLPGAGPLDYLHHAERTALALDPDLIVVGVFANDVNDLYQLRAHGVRSPLWLLGEMRSGVLGPRPWSRRTAERLLPTLYALGSRALARLRAAPPTAHAGATGAGAAPAPVHPEAIVAALGMRYGAADAILARYRALPPAERAALDRFLAGAPLGEDVRPAAQLAALIDPEAEVDGLLLRSAGRRAAAAETAAILGRLVRRGRAAGVDVVLAVLPASEQVDRLRWPYLAALGYRLDPALLVEAPLAEAVRAVAGREGAGFVDLVRAFRARRGARLYHELDEHWNARGHAFAARRLAAALARRLPPESR